MIVLPAIDIKNGQCVRLRQGRAEDVTVYGQDPAEMARRWEREGAQYLHLVDLDGAFRGSGVNRSAVEAVCRALTIPVEVGGGIRTEEDVKGYLSLGAARVILGSAAIERPDFAAAMARTYGADRVAVSIDAKGDRAATHGWTDSSGKEVLPFARELLDSGVSVIIYTDISRDGMLTGPNVDMLEKLNALEGISLIASGGMASPEDLKQLSRLGLYGAICGKALYEGTITMEDVRNIQEASCWRNESFPASM